MGRGPNRGWVTGAAKAQFRELFESDEHKPVKVKQHARVKPGYGTPKRRAVDDLLDRLAHELTVHAKVLELIVADFDPEDEIATILSQQAAELRSLVAQIRA